MSRIRTSVLALTLAAGLAGIAAPAAAQTVGYNIRTGDVWVDTRLGEIDQYGRRYREPFMDELSRHYGAPRPLLVDLLEQRRWAPADVYYACVIAHALGRPCVEVVREYERAPGQGWGEVAKRMGIKPGSKAFHALKRGTVSTYDRWGHPVVLDRNVRVDWSAHGPDRGHHGDHGKGGKAAASSHGGGKAHADARGGGGKSQGHGGHADKGGKGDKGGNGGKQGNNGKGGKGGNGKD